MTTLGFGDVTPKTFMGKLLTSVCVILGLLKVGYIFIMAKDTLQPSSKYTKT